MKAQEELQEKRHQELRELMKQMVPAPTTTATAATPDPNHDPEQEKRKRAMFAGIGGMLAGAKLKKAKTGDSDKDKGKGDVKQKTMMDEMNEKLTNRTAATADDIETKLAKRKAAQQEEWTEAQGTVPGLMSAQKKKLKVGYILGTLYTLHSLHCSHIHTTHPLHPRYTARQHRCHWLAQEEASDIQVTHPPRHVRRLLPRHPQLVRTGPREGIERW